MTHTYAHRFTNGITATMTVTPDRDRPLQVEWSEQPTLAVLPEYLAWRDSAVDDFARRTGVRIAVINLL